MSLSSLLRILLARWWITAALVVVCVGAMSVVSMFMPRKYAASTELIMEGKVQDRVTGETVSARSGYMSTQSEIIRSRRVAERVYEYLPEDVRALVDQRAAEEQAEGKVNPAGWLSGYVRRNLTVEPGKDSSVMTISMTAEDPQVAAGALNSLATAYIDTSIELRTDPARRFSKWYQDQLDVLRGNLREARKNFSDFQQKHGIVGMNEQLDLENARLAELSSRLVEAQDQSTQDQLRSGEGADASIPNSAAIQSLRSELSRAQAELEEMSTRYGERHPEYRRQLAEVQALRQSLATERGIAARSLNSTAEVSESRLQELQQAFDQQKERVLSLKAKRDELDLLQQEVQMAQEAYNAASGRAQSNSLESRLAEASVTVLNKAVPPSLPSSPNIKLNLVIATVLGFLLGVALSLLLELANRRVRSRSDIEETLGIPVLAYLPDTAGTYRQREARTV
ncbi:Wzz/FepE/Etk N-terminal domain-containing protein [Marinobacter lacisalsi]|uniref:Wzz/FepE/Etk N-terminal domain-containing protein n=1 Tax=Marinobacter lacisalsi TaxID=475979 RepID=A0ABV8QMU7_9GAMM